MAKGKKGMLMQILEESFPLSRRNQMDLALSHSFVPKEQSPYMEMPIRVIGQKRIFKGKYELH